MPSPPYAENQRKTLTRTRGENSSKLTRGIKSKSFQQQYLYRRMVFYRMANLHHRRLSPNPGTAIPREPARGIRGPKITFGAAAPKYPSWTDGDITQD